MRHLSKGLINKKDIIRELLNNKQDIIIRDIIRKLLTTKTISGDKEMYFPTNYTLEGSDCNTG